MIRSEGRRLVMILHSGDYDRIHHGLSIALAAVANGMSCSIFVAYDAQSRLTKAQADKIPDDALFKRSLRKLIIEAKQAGSLKLYACGSSLNLMGISREELIDEFDGISGLSSFLAENEGSQYSFFI
ncbi:MAG TPA: DsrE/DsrF/DrsH-like family protein [Nitrososphaerales archaeon]